VRLLQRLSFLYQRILAIIPVQVKTFQGESRI